MNLFYFYFLRRTHFVGDGWLDGGWETKRNGEKNATNVSVHDSECRTHIITVINTAESEL